jgi:hypothetical protein
MELKILLWRPSKAPLFSIFHLLPKSFVDVRQTFVNLFSSLAINIFARDIFYSMVRTSIVAKHEVFTFCTIVINLSNGRNKILPRLGMHNIQKIHLVDVAKTQIVI